jgi:hypothetical protein
MLWTNSDSCRVLLSQSECPGSFQLAFHLVAIHRILLQTLTNEVTLPVRRRHFHHLTEVDRLHYLLAVVRAPMLINDRNTSTESSELRVQHAALLQSICGLVKHHALKQKYKVSYSPRVCAKYCFHTFFIQT